ncbi:MAG: GerMN domain-containing protein [Chloroflexota bacterium]
MFFLVAVGACSGNSAETQRLTVEEINATAVQLAGTMMALTFEAASPTPTIEPTVAPSNTPEPTPSPTATEVLTQLTTLQRANCRNGPGTNYMILVQVDESAVLNIVGRDEGSTWWLVEPEGLDEGCWLFGNLVSLDGLIAEVPVVESSALPLIGNDPRYILYFLIAEETGGTVACGDSLVAINTGILRTGDAAEDAKIALRALLSIGSQYSSGYRHSGYQSNLQVVSAEYNAGTQVVTVNLSGTVIKPEDNCDKERFRVQIFATAQQFDNVAKAYVWVGSKPIGDFLIQL